MDLPGTGELTHAPWSPAAGAVLEGVLAHARSLSDGPLGHVGVGLGATVRLPVAGLSGRLVVARPGEPSALPTTGLDDLPRAARP